MKDGRDIMYAFLAAGFGIWSFFWGFKRLRRKRLIQNIPTSTIRGLAMGLVELYGKAKIRTALKSPLTNTDCVFYMYKVEEYRKSGKFGRWVTIASGNSFTFPFLIDDKTGKAMVFPKNAEVIIPVDFQFSTGLFKKIPEHLINFMNSRYIQYKGWAGFRSLRFKEWYIKEGEHVYVLGSAKSPHTNKLDYKDEPVDAIITGDEVEKTFMISDHSEKELISKLNRQCIMGVFGGAALSLAMLAYLLFRLNIISF